MCNVVYIFAQGNMPVTWNVCVPVLLVTLLIVVSSYEVYVLGLLSAHEVIGIYVALDGHVCFLANIWL